MSLDHSCPLEDVPGVSSYRHLPQHELREQITAKAGEILTAIQAIIPPKEAHDGHELAEMITVFLAREREA